VSSDEDGGNKGNKSPKKRGRKLGAKSSTGDALYDRFVDSMMLRQKTQAEHEERRLKLEEEKEQRIATAERIDCRRAHRQQQLEMAIHWMQSDTAVLKEKGERWFNELMKEEENDRK
jgi:nitrate/TMAO reductase-like tetraheme cytochrome c subunit